MTLLTAMLTYIRSLLGKGVNKGGEGGDRRVGHALCLSELLLFCVVVGPIDTLGKRTQRRRPGAFYARLSHFINKQTLY